MRPTWTPLVGRGDAPSTALNRARIHPGIAGRASQESSVCSTTSRLLTWRRSLRGLASVAAPVLALFVHVPRLCDTARVGASTKISTRSHRHRSAGVAGPTPNKEPCSSSTPRRWNNLPAGNPRSRAGGDMARGDDRPGAALTVTLTADSVQLASGRGPREVAERPGAIGRVPRGWRPDSVPGGDVGRGRRTGTIRRRRWRRHRDRRCGLKRLRGNHRWEGTWGDT